MTGQKLKYEILVADSLFYRNCVFSILRYIWPKMAIPRLFVASTCHKKAEFSELETIMLQSKIFRLPDRIKRCCALRRSRLDLAERIAEETLIYFALRAGQLHF